MSNNPLIEKIITSNNVPCPEFTFENPLLDKNVAKALAKSYVKILNMSRHNSKANTNLRLSILENVRKMCQPQPENHIQVDENITSILLEAYDKKMKKSDVETVDASDKDLDAFLIRNVKELNINSNFSPSVNPEILQACINLKENEVSIQSLCKDVIHWDSTDKNTHILRNLWTNENSMTEDISVKLKPEIERILLEITHKTLTETDTDIKVLYKSDTCINNLAKTSSESANCFQICCQVLNFLFIMTNFNLRVQSFVQMFIENVKANCTYDNFPMLYPSHLSHIVELLDEDTGSLPNTIQKDYIKEAVKYLHSLHKESENTLIMLLSHFPSWFDIYFEIINNNEVIEMDISNTG